MILREAKRHQLIVTLEENVASGGFGSAVLELFAKSNISRQVKVFGIPDHFIEYGKPEEQLKLAGLDVNSLFHAILKFYQQ